MTVKPQELKELTDEEMRQRLLDTKEELFRLRIKKSTGEVDKPIQIRILRRDIARLCTIMKQRGLPS